MFAILLDNFIKKRKRNKILIILLDAAIFHKSKTKGMEGKEVSLDLIPVYCPELNKIEIPLDTNPILLA